MSQPVANPVSQVVEAFAVLNFEDDSSQSSASETSRGRSRERRRSGHLNQYRSLSACDRPLRVEAEEEDGNEHLQALEPRAVLEMVVGASVGEWIQVIAELRRAEVTEPELGSVSVLNTLKKFTNLPIDAIMQFVNLPFDEEEEEGELKYVETIFNRQLKAYQKVYTGELGGKYVFTPAGFKKYRSSEEKPKTVMKDPDHTTVKDFNPAIRTP